MTPGDFGTVHSARWPALWGSRRMNSPSGTGKSAAATSALLELCAGRWIGSQISFDPAGSAATDFTGSGSPLPGGLTLSLNVPSETLPVQPRGAAANAGANGKNTNGHHRITSTGGAACEKVYSAERNTANTVLGMPGMQSPPGFALRSQLPGSIMCAGLPLVLQLAG